MKKGLFSKVLVLGIIVLFIGAGVITSMGGVVVEKTTFGPIKYRGYIQDLIDNASDGDTINIPSGTYYENIVIDKSINLIGEDEETTVIEGNESGSVVSVDADWVNISGFTIKYVNIEGLYGIILYSCNNNIFSNILTENWCGIYLSTASDNNLISCCNFSKNTHPIVIYSSNNNTIIGNNINSNLYAITLSYANSNMIVENEISDNVYSGPILTYSNYNTIKMNNIIGNDFGIKIHYSNDNLIYHNNLIKNRVNGFDEGNNTWDDFYPSGGNYWNDYNGTDDNGDDIGDTPYLIPGGSNQDNYPLMHPFGPPYAEFTYDFITSVFNASISGDYNGKIISYEWDFGDGTKGTGERVYHKFCEAETYYVTLTVTDDDGLSGNITKCVDVLVPNIPPITPEIYGPNLGRPGEDYEYVFIINDPDNDKLYLRVDWGDGDSTGWMVPQHPDEPVKVSHAWNESGTCTIMAKVKDFCAESEWVTLGVTIPRNKALISTWFQWFFDRFSLLETLLSLFR